MRTGYLTAGRTATERAGLVALPSCGRIASILAEQREAESPRRPRSTVLAVTYVGTDSVARVVAQCRLRPPGPLGDICMGKAVKRRSTFGRTGTA